MRHFENSNVRPASPIVFKSGAPVSVVCVAATYTGVTYANNGGKVQLSSAGVHGLTTNPAVGASVYVTWAGGTGVSGLYTILSIDSTLAFTIDLAYVAGFGTPTLTQATTTITVGSATIPPLSKNGIIRVSAVAETSMSVNQKILYAKLNSNSAIVSFSSSSTNALRILGDIKNMGSNTSQIGTAGLFGRADTITLNRLSVNTAEATSLTIDIVVKEVNTLMTVPYWYVEVFI